MDKKGGKKEGDRWRGSTRKGKNGGNGDEGRAKNTDKNITRKGKNGGNGDEGRAKNTDKNIQNGNML